LPLQQTEESAPDRASQAPQVSSISGEAAVAQR
jgi:hypothetical protein